MSNVVHDTDCKVVSGFILLEVFVYSHDLSRCNVLGTETVAACNDGRSGSLLFEECGANVQVQWLAQCAWFLCTIQNSDLLCCARDSCQEVLYRERTIQMYIYEADLFALSVEVVDGLLYSVASGAHRDDDAVSVRRAVVVKQLVVSACELVDLAHVVLYNLRQLEIERVACLACLEEDIRVLSGAAQYGMLRVQRVVTECLDSVPVNDLCEVVIVEGFDLLDFV